MLNLAVLVIYEMYRTELSLLQSLLPFEANVDAMRTVSLGTKLRLLIIKPSVYLHNNFV